MEKKLKVGILGATEWSDRDLSLCLRITRGLRL